MIDLAPLGREKRNQRNQCCTTAVFQHFVLHQGKQNSAAESASVLMPHFWLICLHVRKKIPEFHIVLLGFLTGIFHFFTIHLTSQTKLFPN